MSLSSWLTESCLGESSCLEGFVSQVSSSLETVTLTVVCSACTESVLSLSPFLFVILGWQGGARAYSVGFVLRFSQVNVHLQLTLSRSTER